MKGRSHLIAFFVAAAAALPGASTAKDTFRTLTRDGRVLAVEAGLHEAFFETGSSPDGLSVLVIGTTTTVGTTYELVPSTDDAAVETAPLLLHDTRTDRTTVLWESRGDERYQVRLAQRGSDGAWSEAHTLVDLDAEQGTVFRAVSTHSVQLTLPDARTARAERDLIHLAWWQEDNLQYKASILAGGAFVAVPFVADLSASIDDGGVVSPIVPAAALRETVSVEGLDSGGLLATFVDRATDRLMTVELGVAHVETAFFVDTIVGQLLAILDPAAPLTDGLRAEMIAGGLRAEMIAGGIRVGMDEDLLDFLATTGEAFTQGFFDLNPTATAEDWVTTLSALLGDLIRSIYQTAGAAAGPLQIDLGENEAIRVEQVFEHPSPSTGEGPTRMYAAEGGSSAIVGWYEPSSETVFWVESTSDPEAPWTAPRALELGDDLGIDDADALLRGRVR